MNDPGLFDDLPFWYDYFETMREAGSDPAARGRALSELIAVWAILDKQKREEARHNEQRTDSI